MATTVPRLAGVITQLILIAAAAAPAIAEDSRLLLQPTLSDDRVAFTHGGDLWVAERRGGVARRLTSTPAVESDPHFSPDGRHIAFTSDRSGGPSVYVMSAEGGPPKRLTWYPAASYALGWTPDGSRILYASSRETAPTRYQRLWTVSPDGGPSTLLPAPWGHDGFFAPDGRHIVIDRVARWDSEWRHYRGGQNTPLVVLDLEGLDEVRVPNERSTDRHPVWLGDSIFFVSDRSWCMNIFAYDPARGTVTQLTDFDDGDVKWLDGRDDTLVFERDGWIHTFDLGSGDIRRLEIEVRADFPWAEPRWENVTDEIRSAALSATGQRALFEARGEVFTVPVDKGDPRNLTRSSGAADRKPIWSPDGTEIAWFSDAGQGYQLLIADQDGLSEPRRLDLGESVMAWEPAWAPDGRRIAFVDDDTRVRVIDLETGELTTAGASGANIDRGAMGLSWSPDSQWLAYTRSFANNLHRVVVWSVDGGEPIPITGPLADSVEPAWDRGGRFLYLLASTNLALASGWANTSTIQADPTYAAYVVVLRSEDPSPFEPESDEEAGSDAENEGAADEPEAEADAEAPDAGDEPAVEVRLDIDGISRRTLALPMPEGRYFETIAGPEGTVFIAEAGDDGPGSTLHRFSLEDREATRFLEQAGRISISADGSTLLYSVGDAWRVAGTDSPPSNGGEALQFTLEMRLDRRAEWQQIFTEAWRYQRDFFYDPDLHGRDWEEVWDRYQPLVAHVHHRADLNTLLDRVNGELSVGHSFVFGGDLPETDDSKVGLLGADLTAEDGRWRISRIYTFESWNPGVSAPLDRPGLEVEAGDFILAVNGVELAADDDPYRLFDGTAGRQTVLLVNDTASIEGARRVTVEPVDSEQSLRQLAWVEDNRRLVDRLSDGTLAYVWVPNTSTRGVISFNRYFFAQQDRLGAVIDARFNGGGLLDDYMVDLMTRRLRAAITNEVPDGRPFRLPAGILGPKVLLINEMAGSGGDYFPWVFRQQSAGPLIGTRTWGGLVKSSVHYSLVDGGALTAPDNAVFDPIRGTWVAENKGVPPDIEVLLDARSVAAGRDPQLERGVAEALALLEAEPASAVKAPPFPTPAARP